MPHGSSAGPSRSIAQLSGSADLQARLGCPCRHLPHKGSTPATLPLSHEALGKVHRVLRRAPQTARGRDNEASPTVESITGPIKLWPGCSSAQHPSIDVEVVAANARGQQVLFLAVGILPFGRYPLIASHLSRREPHLFRNPLWIRRDSLLLETHRCETAAPQQIFGPSLRPARRLASLGIRDGRKRQPAVT